MFVAKCDVDLWQTCTEGSCIGVAEKAVRSSMASRGKVCDEKALVGIDAEAPVGGTKSRASVLYDCRRSRNY
jgi:hypothetical protein